MTGKFNNFLQLSDGKLLQMEIYVTGMAANDTEWALTNKEGQDEEDGEVVVAEQEEDVELPWFPLKLISIGCDWDGLRFIEYDPRFAG